MTLNEIRFLEKRGDLTIRPKRPVIPGSVPLPSRRRLHRAVGIALRVIRRHELVAAVMKDLGATRQYVTQELNLGISYLEDTGWFRIKGS